MRGRSSPIVRLRQTLEPAASGGHRHRPEPAPFVADRLSKKRNAAEHRRMLQDFEGAGDGLPNIYVALPGYGRRIVVYLFLR